jgi:hypothetical protein
MMLVGLDFDNTIVCYDGLFYQLARERRLIPADLPATKGHVRDYLRAIGREPDWTEMQGIGYGPRIVDASPFPGVKAFLTRCVKERVQCVIISHKTRHPYLGEKHDLHEAAHRWLKAHGFYETAATGLSIDSVHLALTKEQKLDRIGALGCDVFIDDLPEFLNEPSFPKHPKRILFDPANTCAAEADYQHADSWDRVATLVFGSGGCA